MFINFITREHLLMDASIYDVIGSENCSIDVIVDKCGGDSMIALRCGVLVALGRLKCVGGGGIQPYILTILDPNSTTDIFSQ